MEKPTMSEDASPIENGDFLAVLVFGGVHPDVESTSQRILQAVVVVPPLGPKTANKRSNIANYQWIYCESSAKKHDMYMCNDYDIIFKK